MDCLVRDESANGARLMITESVTVPSEFDIAYKDRTRIRRVELAWRRGDLVGVKSMKAS